MGDGAGGCGLVVGCAGSDGSVWGSELRCGVLEMSLFSCAGFWTSVVIVKLPQAMIREGALD